MFITNLCFMNINSHISERAKNIPKSPIHEMTELSNEIDDVAFLSWAKPTSDTPAHIKNAAIEAINKGKTAAYSQTSGLPELKECVTKKLKQFNNIDATPDEILISVGAIEGLAAALMATVNPGEEGIIPTPGYSSHIRQVELTGGKPVMVPTKEAEGFKMDLEKIESAITSKTKAILLSNPNNPTGAVYSKEQLEELAGVVKRNELIVIVDEAYEYFTFDGYQHFSIASLEGMHDRVISVFTFTKTYAMTGWRVGYIHARADWIPQIIKMHIPIAICAPVVSQYAAIAALEGEQDCIAEFRNHYNKIRKLMCARLNKLNGIFDYQTPRGAYLMFPRINHPDGNDSLNFAKKLLKEAGVSTTPGIAFYSEGHIRLSFCVPEEMVRKAFDRMEDYFGIK